MKCPGKPFLLNQKRHYKQKDQTKKCNRLQKSNTDCQKKTNFKVKTKKKNNKKKQKQITNWPCD